MTTDIEKKLREIVETSTRKAAKEEWSTAAEKQLVPLYNYRLDHIDEVVDLAKVLATGTEADLKVITLAAWLHDLAKPGIGGIPAEHHGVASAEMAKEILSAEKVNQNTIEHVADVIEKHVGLTIKEPLEPIEAQILWEADKLLKLGMIGFTQGLLNGIRLFPGRSISEIVESLHEFIPLATDIVACMVTKRGKKIAAERLDTFKTLIEHLDAELQPENKDV
ncbi:MAG: HD domain-containing protein [Candidatus Thorarchaeota archaeon]